MQVQHCGPHVQCRLWCAYISRFRSESRHQHPHVQKWLVWSVGSEISEVICLINHTSLKGLLVHRFHSYIHYRKWWKGTVYVYRFWCMHALHGSMVKWDCLCACRFSTCTPQWTCIHRHTVAYKMASAIWEWTCVCMLIITILLLEAVVPCIRVLVCTS